MNAAGFDWDEGNWPKCGRHGLEKDEIESVFMNAPRVFPDMSHSTEETRLLAIGRGMSGRMVFVAFTFRDSSDRSLIRPISARYMHAREIETYENR